MTTPVQLPQIIVRPAKRYNQRGAYQRGARRHDGPRGRALALFDTIGVRKRGEEFRIMLSAAGRRTLASRAAEANVSPSTLAAYLVESALRAKS